LADQAKQIEELNEQKKSLSAKQEAIE